jgi:hypothetical protein
MLIASTTAPAAPNESTLRHENASIDNPHWINPTPTLLLADQGHGMPLLVRDNLATSAMSEPVAYVPRLYEQIDQYIWHRFRSGVLNRLSAGPFCST